jgi:hypothetical protein
MYFSDLAGPSQPVSGRCSVDEATCRNGRCIPRSYLFDGKNDCGDNSDEAGRKFDFICEFLMILILYFFFF